MRDFFVSLQYGDSRVYYAYADNATDALKDFLTMADTFNDIQYVEDGDEFKVVVADENASEIFTIKYTSSWNVVDQ